MMTDSDLSLGPSKGSHMTDSLTRLRIGTRRSALALYLIADLLREAHPELTVEIVEIDTKGDKIRDIPLPEIGGKGLFTYEIEQQLLSQDIELAVHSLKDLPSDLGEQLIWAGSPTRAAATDAFISHKWDTIDAIPEGGTIATGSVRRRAQIATLRPDLSFVDLRGNIDTRLAKLEKNGWDGIIMATAALHRLEMSDTVTQELAPDRVVPAVGQGAIGVEIKEGREDVMALLAPIFDEATTLAARAERAFMRKLEGGCSVPVAGHATETDGGWSFRGWVGAPDGSKHLTGVLVGEDPVAMAEAMADDFIENGARAMMKPTTT